MNRDKTLLKFVRDYKEEHPNFSRSELATMIRLERNITNPSELRKLRRYLEKEFEVPPQPPQPPHPYVTIDGEEPEHRRRHLGGLFYTEIDQSK